MNKTTDISIINFKNLFIPDSSNMPTRRYDLDWLRIIAFALLILFHTGMFYVENWGWHVKSAYNSQILENFMLIIEPWRMPILWLIAGISIKFLLVKVSLVHFISMRSIRLLIPLLFGILVIVPPQLFIEMTYNGDLTLNYWQFTKEFFSPNSSIFSNYQSGIWPHIDVNHLWFIRSLWQYSLVLLCLTPFLNSKWVVNSMNWFFKQNGLITMMLAVFPIFIIQLNWDSEQVRYPLGFTFMLYGYLIGWNELFWKKVTINNKKLLSTYLIFYIILLIFYNLVWLDLIKGAEIKNELMLIIGMFNYSLVRILGILAIFGFAHKYLNKKTKHLNYFNNAVYPFYILHQTIIIVVGFNLSKLSLGPVAEPIILIISTISCCFIGYEIIRRVEFLKPCFGLKMNANHNLSIKRLGYLLAIALILPIGWEIVN